MSTLEILGLIALCLMTLIIVWLWWIDPYRQCVKCGSRLTFRHKTVSERDSHLNNLWHIYHNIFCLKCREKSIKKELTGYLPWHLKH